MKVSQTAVQGVLLIEPQIHGDDRGFFYESWRQDVYAEAGIAGPFVQDNHSRSAKGVLRGIHYQIQQPQGKLVRATRGAVFDVAVDLRRSSPSFGQWTGHELSEDNRLMLWVPPGCGHGFLTLSDEADFQYKCTAYYAPEHERTILWNDPDIGIGWPLDGDPSLSGKDAQGVPFAEAELYP
ncbi:dTDP-4-dehydrorhamnose 3,5-epimerase [Parasphingopyxis marina]|uniref:dTDP-4-dehydrorhamnose 3,5-epimerase n=1 Tax=Parasphingopyxis marina TaxID=2761622 RepID=A0A842HYT6_9SPHN|nr:dTDP-4-dehydrorhamnose 3,5-epimerase [Parasphingopyxis marina]MBC2778005.1 dTDP-4-dehydrorhamnose 3,5-epimerase [Parasphingopyxis marina]